MLEIPQEYWNKLAEQLILISSLLSGFSIAVVANLLVHESKTRINNSIFKIATIAAGCFLVSVFASTSILMKTTPGYPLPLDESSLFFPQIVCGITFLLGIASLSAVLALSGWTKSKATGIFTTIIGVITFLFVLTFLTN